MRRWHWLFCALLASGVFFNYQGIPLDSGRTSIGVPLAQAKNGAEREHAKKKRAIRRCVGYEQEMEEDGLRISLRNECSFDLSCTLSWRVRCDADEPDMQRRKAEVFTLDEGVSDGAFASAAICGDDGWRVSEVRWSCEDAAD